MARSCTVLYVCKGREENDEQGREFSKQQWNHCCAEAKQLVLSSTHKAKAGALWLGSSFAFCQSTLKLLSPQGDSPCNCIPLDSRLWKKGQNKPYMLPESLKCCRKALTKAFAWLLWPFTQGLISRGPWDFFSFSFWSYAYCWVLALLRDGLCSPYSLWICAISISPFHFKT